MIKITNLVKKENCPICGDEVVITLDSEDGDLFWIHEIFRKCGCEIVFKGGVFRNTQQTLIEQKGD
jgi:hypothetical protein